MNPSKDISDDIIKYVQEACQEILSSQNESSDAEAMAAVSERFMKVKDFKNVILCSPIYSLFYPKSNSRSTWPQPSTRFTSMKMVKGLMQIL